MDVIRVRSVVLALAGALSTATLLAGAESAAAAARANRSERSAIDVRVSTPRLGDLTVATVHLKQRTRRATDRNFFPEVELPDADRLSPYVSVYAGFLDRWSKGGQRHLVVAVFRSKYVSTSGLARSASELPPALKIRLKARPGARLLGASPDLDEVRNALRTRHVSRGFRGRVCRARRTRLTGRARLTITNPLLMDRPTLVAGRTLTAPGDAQRVLQTACWIAIGGVADESARGVQDALNGFAPFSCTGIWSSAGDTRLLAAIRCIRDVNRVELALFSRRCGGDTCSSTIWAKVRAIGVAPPPQLPSCAVSNIGSSPFDGQKVVCEGGILTGGRGATVELSTSAPVPFGAELESALYAREMNGTLRGPFWFN